MNYPGGKPRKFPFSGYTLVCCICLDSGSVGGGHLLNTFATYSESFPFLCVYVRWVYFYYHICLINLFFKILLWYHF